MKIGLSAGLLFWAQVKRGFAVVQLHFGFVRFKPTALAALISHEVAAGQQSLAMFGGIHLVRFHGSPTQQEIHV